MNGRVNCEAYRVLTGGLPEPKVIEGLPVRRAGSVGQKRRFVDPRLDGRKPFFMPKDDSSLRFALSRNPSDAPAVAGAQIIRFALNELSLNRSVIGWLSVDEPALVYRAPELPAQAAFVSIIDRTTAAYETAQAQTGELSDDTILLQTMRIGNTTANYAGVSVIWLPTGGRAEFKDEQLYSLEYDPVAGLQLAETGATK